MIQRILSITLLLASAQLYANNDLKLLSNALLTLAVAQQEAAPAGAGIPDAPGMGDTGIPPAPAFDAPPAAPAFDAPPLQEEAKGTPAQRPAGNGGLLAQIQKGRKLRKVTTNASGEQPATPTKPTAGAGTGSAGAAGTPKTPKQPQTPGMMEQMAAAQAARAARAGTPGKPGSPKAEEKKTAAAGDDEGEETPAQKATREAKEKANNIRIAETQDIPNALGGLEKYFTDNAASWAKQKYKAIEARNRLKAIQDRIAAYKKLGGTKDFDAQIKAFEDRIAAKVA